VKDSLRFLNFRCFDLDRESRTFQNLLMEFEERDLEVQSGVIDLWS
jgi:hypothetical protein